MSRQQLIPEALDYLTRYPLSDEQLGAVERIEFDGGAAIYPFAWYFWGGKEGVFDIKDISMMRRFDVPLKRDGLAIEFNDSLTMILQAGACAQLERAMGALCRFRFKNK